MRKTIIQGIAVCAMFLLLFADIPASTASKEQGPASIHSIVQASTLSQKAKSELNTRVSSAMSAGIPAEDVAIILSRSMNRNDDVNTIGRLLDLCIDVKKRGLPVSPVLDRIEQGLAKGISKKQVNAASHRLSVNMETARPVINGLRKNGMKDGNTHDLEMAIEAVARALEQNVSFEAVARIGTAVRIERKNLTYFASAMNSTTYLVAKGMSGDYASRMIVDAVSKGSAEKGLDNLARYSNDDMKRESAYDGTDQRPKTRQRQ